jgi:hypothetical protein
VIVTAGTIRRAAQTVLKQQLPAVLDGLAEQEGMGLPPIVTWRRLSDFLLITDLQSPAMVVTTPGVADTAERRGRDQRADWLVRVFTVVRGRTYEETADRVAAYVAAARTVLLSDADLGGLAAGCQWVRESYSELDNDKERTVGAGSVTVRYARILTGLVPDPSDPAARVPATGHLVTVDPRST